MFVVFRRSARGRTQSQAAARVRTNQLALLPGPWRLVFPSESGASDCRIEKLRDLSRFEDEAIRHFSGTATYEFVGDVQVPVLRSEERIVLDLGEVHEIAEVSVNGKTYPPLWRPPFRIDVTEALAGTRTLRLSVKVTNLWPNRLIGDAALPEDCAWKKADVGRSLLRIPDFVIRNEKSPSGRRTFATWDHWKADDNLLPSGLIGPVRLDSVWQEGRRPLRSNP